MKADWDDAPRRVSRKRKPMLGATMLALALVAGALYLVDRNGWWDYLPHQFTARLDTSASTPLLPQPQQPSAPVSAAAPIRNIEPAPSSAHGKQAGRQTHFSDDNYRPRTDVNTIQPPPPSYATATRPARARQGIADHYRTVTLRWEDARGRHYQWTGNYRWRAEIIINDDFCAGGPYSKGSIEYRACRKAAKVYLRHQCRSHSVPAYRRLHCQAENAFRH